MGILAMSLSQSQSRGVQMAAAQVASGMGLARQTAINKNTQAALIIAPIPSAANSGLLPDEVYRHFAIVYSNRTTGNWVLVKDWEPLAPGAVFYNILMGNYSPLTWPQPSGKAGDEVVPVFQESTNSMKISLETSPAKVEGTLTGLVPFVMFNPDGGATRAGSQGMAVGVAEGVSLGTGKVVPRSLDNFAYIETDSITGKAVIKMRENYSK
jgi:hypothetical protein